MYIPPSWNQLTSTHSNNFSISHLLFTLIKTYLRNNYKMTHPERRTVARVDQRIVGAASRPVSFSNALSNKTAQLALLSNDSTVSNCCSYVITIFRCLFREWTEMFRDSGANNRGNKIKNHTYPPVRGGYRIQTERRNARGIRRAATESRPRLFTGPARTGCAVDAQQTRHAANSLYERIHTIRSFPWFATPSSYHRARPYERKCVFNGVMRTPDEFVCGC